MSKKSTSASAKIETAMDESIDLARRCVWAAQEKKALDPIILDLRSI